MQINHRKILILIFLLISTACKNESAEKPSPVEEKKSVSDAVASLPYTPTNPGGGITKGKSPQLDPKENALNQAINSSKPIIWGTEVAGIRLGMREDEVNNILSRKVQSTEAYDIYAEGVQVVWSSEEPRTAATILAGGSYGGALELAEPLGVFRIGGSVAPFFVDDPFGGDFLRAFGAAVENQPASYDCREQLSCRFAQFNGLSFFEYRKGGLAVNANLEIRFIYLGDNEGLFFPRVTQDSLFESSIAGQTTQITRSEFEKAIGLPQGNTQSGLILYDDFNVVALWGESQTPLLLGVQGDYRGKIDFATELMAGKSKFSIGDSFASVNFSEAEKEQAIFDLGLNQEAEDFEHQLMINYINHKFRVRDAAASQEPSVDYRNCLIEHLVGDKTIAPTCQISSDNTTIRLDFPRGSLGLSNNADKTLLFVTLTQEVIFSNESP